MPRIEKRKQTIRDRAAAEYAVAQTLKNEANIEYIALMADIELPGMGEEVQNNVEG